MTESEETPKESAPVEQEAADIEAPQKDTPVVEEVETEEFKDEDDNGKNKKSINWKALPTVAMTSISNASNQVWTATSSQAKSISDSGHEAWKSNSFTQHLCNMNTALGKVVVLLIVLTILTVFFLGGFLVRALTSPIERTIVNLGSLMEMDHALVAHMGPHPQYGGPNFPYGKITLRFDEKAPTLHTQNFLATFQMKGLDICNGKCRYRILKSNSCDDTNVGDLFNLDMNLAVSPFDHAFLDPHGGSFFHTDTDGNSDSVSRLSIGLTAKETLGHAIVLYNSGNAPVSCGILQGEGHPTNRHLRYYVQPTALLDAYRGGVIGGFVELDFSMDGSFGMTLNLEGMPGCTQGCQIEIHDGYECVHDHWGQPWYTESAENAYRDVLYVGSQEQGRTYYLNNGYKFDDFEGKLWMMRNENGYIFACGVIEQLKGRLETPAVEEVTASLIQEVVGV